MNVYTERLKLITRSPFWAILPDAFAHLAARLFEGAPMMAERGTTKPTLPGRVPSKLAVIPIRGVLTKDGPEWLGSNYDSIADAAEKAAADPSVKHIVLSVDSPGGEVVGLPETAAVLAQLAKVKPVSAMVEGLSASAAYWLTSQANEIAVTPSGELGSVGVKMMHMDISKMLEDQGVKVTELYSGDFKTEWSPFAPVKAEAVAYMQSRLTTVHKNFIGAVASGRGNRATKGIQAALFGGGRMFSAIDAMGHGLADTVQSPREFYRAVAAADEESKPSTNLWRARLALEHSKF